MFCLYRSGSVEVKTKTLTSSAPTPQANQNKEQNKKGNKKQTPTQEKGKFISGGLEPVLSQTEKLCIASYYIQFSTNIKMYNLKIKTIFLAYSSGISRLIKLVLNL